MLKILKIFWVSIFLVLLNFNFCFAANLTDAFKTDKVSAPLREAGDVAGYQVDTTVTIEDTIAAVINIVLSFLGVIFLLLMIYGGYIWMMARGNEQEVEKAQGIIKAAVVGVIVVVSSYALSWFILQKLGEKMLK